MNDIAICSVMICEFPARVGDCWLMSASDEVWDSIKYLPKEIVTHLSDEVGNQSVTYFGAVQFVSSQVLGLLDDVGLFSCFRGVRTADLAKADVVPNAMVYQSLKDDLRLIGWDVCSGNGWLPASLEGNFPANPLTGEPLNDDFRFLNKFLLFSHFDDALSCCVSNDNLVQEHAPWYPVGVYISKRSFDRLEDAA